MSNDFDDKVPSKSQKKREMAHLKDLAARLVEIPMPQLEKLPYDDILEAVELAKKITKGNARKRQIGFIAKQLSKVDVEPITDIVDKLDASSAAYVKHFHQLENWREQLMTDERSALSEICGRFPDTDRQHLRQLVRNAVSERATGEKQTHYRKLFQYLKELSD